MAVYNPKHKTYLPVCKLAMGATKDNKKELQQMVKLNKLDQQNESYIVDKKMEPDVWIQPTELWTVKYADYVRSSVYTIGKGFDGKNLGLTLKNPSFIKREAVGEGLTSDEFQQNIMTEQKLLDSYFSENFEQEII